MSNEVLRLSNLELDTIGEVMNISMGAAATAISSMLDRQVNITTPKIRQETLKTIDCSELEPAIIVKIRYVEGIDGVNVIILRRKDMQLILNLLMGNDENDLDENFEFDEMSMSAACEVMNQMMGASATALSEVLGMSINISTPESMLADSISDAYASFDDVDVDDEVVAISFELDISKVLNTTFTSFMPTAMAKKIAGQVMKDLPVEEVGHQTAPAAAAAPAQPQPEPAAAPAPQAAAQEPVMAQQTPVQPAQPAQPQQQVPMQQAMPQQQAPVQPAVPQQQVPVQPAMPQQMPGQMGMPQQMAGMPQQMPGQMGMPQQMPWPGQYPGMYGGYPMYPQQPQMQPAPSAVNVKKAEFPAFTSSNGVVGGLADSNFGLLMNIPLEVSVVIGKTRRKIKDIINWGQGAVVELDKQTGAPAEIIVNGQLLAYGDVVVIDDNFGIRVTEIVGTEELLESLTGNKNAQ